MRSSGSGNSSQYLRSSVLGGVDVLHACFTTHSFAKHTHDEYVIAVMHEGAEAFRCGGRPWVAGPDSVTVINPGDSHDGHGATEARWSYTAFYLNPELLREVADEAAMGAVSAPEFRDAVVRDEGLRTAFVRAESAVRNGSDPLYAESQLLKALYMLIRRHANRRARHNERASAHSCGAKRAAQILSDRWADDLSLAAIAAEVGLNRFQLLKAFRNRYDLPPHAYQLNIRVRRAQEMLARGESLADVALRAGFCDQSHFARRFRNIVGVSPGTYAAVTSAPSQKRSRAR